MQNFSETLAPSLMATNFSASDDFIDGYYYDEEPLPEVTPLSYGQFVTLQILCKTTSLLSILGSSLIIWSIARQHKNQQRRGNNHNTPIIPTLRQLLLGLSSADLVSSMANLTASIMLPKDSLPDYPWALGNQATCDTNAFLYILASSATAFYNCFISIHFWRTVRATRSVGNNRKWVFPLVAHCVSISIPLVLAVGGLWPDHYAPHPFLGICYYESRSPHPHDVVDVDLEEDPDKQIYRFGRMQTFILLTVSMVSIAFTISLARRVRAKLKKSQEMAKRWVASGATEETNEETVAPRSSNASIGLSSLSSLSALSLASSVVGRNSSTGFSLRNSIQLFRSNANTTEEQAEPQESEAQRPQQQRPNKDPNDKKYREISRQACWYTAAYCNTFMVPTLAMILILVTDARYNAGKPQYFALLVIMRLCMPLQGFLNFLVYIRPRYNAWHKHYQKQSERTGEDLPPRYKIVVQATLEDTPKRGRR